MAKVDGPSRGTLSWDFVNYKNLNSSYFSSLLLHMLGIKL
jgi:hypothetical protein